MKNILMLGLVAGVLFGVSAGLSMFLNQPKEAAAGDGKKGEHGDKGAKEHKDGDKAHGEKPHGEKPHVEDKGPHAPPKPVVHAPPSDGGELVPYAKGVQNEQDQVAKRAADVERRQDMQRFVLEDIRAEMEALQKQLKELANAKPAPPRVDEPAKPHDHAPAPAPDAKPAKAPALEAPEAPNKGAKQAVAIFEGMAPEKAAAALEAMAKDGKFDVVVDLLTRMNQKQASKIFPLFTDQPQALKILEAINRPPAAGQRPSATDK